MKKKLSLALCVLLTGLMIVGLCACSGSAEGNDAVKGTYKASKVSMAGFEMTAAEVEMEGFVLDFNGAGKVKISVDEASETVAYTLDGNTVSFEVDGVSSTGTLNGTTLTFEDFMNYGIGIAFEKQ